MVTADVVLVPEALTDHPPLITALAYLAALPFLLLDPAAVAGLGRQR